MYMYMYILHGLVALLPGPLPLLRDALRLHDGPVLRLPGGFR